MTQTRSIALLLDRIDDPYQNDLLAALRAGALERPVSIVCFLGGAPAPDVPEDPRNLIFEYAAQTGVAGAVVGAATLGGHVGREIPARIVSKLKPLPVATVGVALEGIPAVTLDNREGMHKLVSHLIEAHGRRRVAFVRGPQLNDEAEERYRGYLRALSDHGIAVDDRIVLPGDFDRVSGALAATSLIERGCSFDAVVGANDRMAFGALAELRNRGIDVPGRVAIVGFDDSQEARLGLCPLTSMRQPIRALADLALDLVLDPAGRGGRVLPAELVLRRSCGCEGDRPRASLAPARSDQETPLLRRRAQLVDAMRRTANIGENEEWAEDLFVSFVADVRGKTQIGFASQIERLLELLAREGQDPSVAQQVVDVLRSGALPALTELPGMLLRAESALYGAGLSIASALRSDGQQFGLSFHASSHVLGCIAQELTMRVGIEQIGGTLDRYLPQLGIPSAGLSVFRHKSSALIADWSDLEWIWTYGGNEAHWWKQQSRPGRSLSMARSHTSIVVPLTFENRILGVASFEVGPIDGVVFETLRALLSSALAHAAARTGVASLCA